MTGTAVAQAPPPTPPTLPPPPTSLPPRTTLPPTTLPPPPTRPPTTPPPTTAATSTTTTAVPTHTTTTSGSSSVAPIAIGVVVLAAIVALVLIVRRQRPRRRPGAMDELLEVSRRLTTAATTGDIDAAIVRDALGLVRGSGAAIVHQEGDRLRVGHESHEGLVVQRVAETGQPIVQVSATEAAIRNLPASLIAVPLVGGGRVAAVVVVVRAADAPFRDDERDTLLALAPVAAAALQNAKTARATLEETMIDPLTGIGNRRRLDAELAAALDRQGVVALVMVDLDHFKSVNDTHGHPAGDKLLQQVAREIRDTIRPVDSVYRFGGEEFCVVLRDAGEGSEDALEIAERIRAAVGNRTYDVGAGTPLQMTASLGVATASDDDADRDAAALLARADGALYAAKRDGRNRVCSA